jgi:hypothetical protein
MQTLTLVVVLCVISAVSAGVLQASFWTDDQCAAASPLSLFVQMDSCIAAPKIPASLNVSVDIPVKSLKASCTQNADGSIKIEGKGYATSSKCSGLGVPVKETLPAGCKDSLTYFCAPDASTLDPIANDWPSIGLYFGDSGCGTTDAMLSFQADTCVKTSDSESVQITGSDTEYVATMYGDTTCATQTKTENVPKTQCLNLETMAAQDLAVSTFYRSLPWESFADKGVERPLQGGGADMYAFAATAKSVPGAAH